jgi:ATP-dependent exoDNAse (exonuclease V) beta subunit
LELARQRAWVGESLARYVSRRRLAAARRRADRVLDRLVAGPLWSRLEDVAPRVIGRELPVLVGCEGEADGPVAYATGAIDLVYQDAATGDLVVADFKSDEIDDEAALERKVERYWPQGRAYCKAVAEALRPERPPRFELWFLAADRVVEPDAKRGRSARESEAPARA